MTRKNERSGRVPEWLVERLAAGDLPPARAAEVQRRLGQEPEGLARLSAIAISNDEILAAHPPALIAGHIHRQAAEPSRSGSSTPDRPRRWLFAFGTPTLAVAALGLALWLRTKPPLSGEAGGREVSALGGEVNDEGDRIKGLAPDLRVYRKLGQAVERLPSGATAHAGDQLQLAYVAAGRRFGAVVSVDGAGQVTFHLPATGGPAPRLRTDGEIALSEAYELDSAPGFERFVFAAANTPFDASALAAVARGAMPASTLPAAVVVSFTLRKE